MQVNQDETFSQDQKLALTGDTVSRVIQLDPAVELPGVEIDRPSILVQAAIRPRTLGETFLLIELFHSKDGRRFEFGATLLERVQVTTTLPRVLVLGKLPRRLNQYLQLRYRVTGDPLTAAAMNAFLTNDSSEGMAGAPAQRFHYARSGFTV